MKKRTVKDFIALYIHGKTAADALKSLENIPLESEELFLGYTVFGQSLFQIIIRNKRTQYFTCIII